MPKKNADIPAGKRWQSMVNTSPNWLNFGSEVDRASAILNYIENLCDRTARGNVVARIRLDHIDPTLDEADVIAEDGYQYHDKDTFAADGDIAYRVVQSGTRDTVGATQSFSLQYPTYNKPNYGAGIQEEKSRVEFGTWEDIPNP